MKIKSRFVLKRGVLLDLKISDFGWKGGVFLVQNPRKGGIFLAWVRAWYTFWSSVGAGQENASQRLIHGEFTCCSDKLTCYSWVAQKCTHLLISLFIWTIVFPVCSIAKGQQANYLSVCEIWIFTQKDLRKTRTSHAWLADCVGFL